KDEKQDINEQDIFYREVLFLVLSQFCSEVVKEQLPLSVEGLRRPGSRTVRPQCGPRFPLRLPSCRFLIMCMSSMPTSVDCAASNALNPNIGRVIRFTPLWSCSTMPISSAARNASKYITGMLSLCEIISFGGIGRINDKMPRAAS